MLLEKAFINTFFKMPNAYFKNINNFALQFAFSHPSIYIDTDPATTFCTENHCWMQVLRFHIQHISIACVNH